MNKHLVYTALAMVAATPMALAQSTAQPTMDRKAGDATRQQSDSGRAGTMSTDQTTTGATGNAAEVGTQNFVQKVAMSNQFEIESSKLAVEKATDPDIKQFAQQMIADHTSASEKLQKTLQQAGANMSPPTGMALDAKHKQVMDKLTAASGKEFDRAYLQAQMEAHKEAVALFENYAKNGDEAVLKSFAEATLPTLKMHWQHLQKIDKAA